MVTICGLDGIRGKCGIHGFCGLDLYLEVPTEVNYLWNCHGDAMGLMWDGQGVDGLLLVC